MEEKVFQGLQYLISYPNGFREDEKYPLIIFLHGAGYRGKSTERLKENTCVEKLIKRQDERGYVVLAPFCPRGTWYEWMMILVQMVKEYRSLSYIDETRIYLTGNSMGGYGTWALATLYPHWFAAIMPICGGGIPGFAMNLVELPIRTFHGLQDTIVDPIESIQMVKAVNRLGGHAELTLFPDRAHNCWGRVYNNEENYDWLLSFTAPQDRDPEEDPSLNYYGKKKDT